MTKGEALKKMQAVKAYMTSGNPIWDVIEIGEAFDMAIEALEQPEQTSKETIYRQDAIDLVRGVCDAVMSECESWYDPESKDEVYKDIREVDAILKCNKKIRIALRNMPSAQPEPQNPYSICDLCIYNPPSSRDGKPCSMCVAQEKPKDDDSWSYG